MINDSGKIWYSTGIDNSQLQKDAEKAKGLIGSIGQKAVDEGSRIDNTLSNLSRAVATVFTIQQATNFAREIANVRGEFQQLEIAFTTMLRSKERADKLMLEVVDFAATTPFDLQGVASGAKQLLAYGFTADSIRENLTMLGNVAAGVGSQIGDIIYLYGTLNAQGKVMTKDLMQFAGRGIPIYKELAAVLQVTEKEVMDLASSGQLSFQHVEQAFKNMVSSSGMFHNLMQEQSKSITGQLSNLGDSIDQMFNEMGQSSEGVITSAISGASYLVENYQKVGEIIASLVALYGTYKAAVMVFNVAQSTSIALSKGWTVAELAKFKALVMVEGAQKLLNKTMLANPYVAATMAVVSLTTALIFYARSAKKAQSETQMLGDITKEAETNIKAEITELSGLRKVLDDSTKGYSDRKKALDKIKEVVPDYHASLTTEGTLINNNSEALDSYVKKLKYTEQVRIAVAKQAEAQETLDSWKTKNRDVLANAVAKKYGGRENEMFAGEKAAMDIYKRLSDEAHKYSLVIDKLQEEMLKVTPDSPDFTAPEKEDKNTSKLLDQIKAEKVEIQRAKEDLYFNRVEAELELLEDGSAKELAQLELNLRRKITEINRQEEELLQVFRNHAKKEWEAKGGQGAFNENTITLPKEQADEFERMRDAESKSYDIAQGDVYKKLLVKYQTYAEQRKSIEEKFQKDIAELSTKFGADNSAVRVANEQMKKALDELAKEVLQDNGSGLLDLYLFGDGTDFLTSKIKEALPLFEDITKLSYNELSKIREVIDKVTFTDKQLALFEEAGIDVEKLKTALDEAKESADEMLDVKAWEKVVEMARKLSDSLGELGDSLSTFSGALGQIGKAISGISGSLDDVLTAFVKNATSTDFVSAGISGLSTLLSMVGNQIAENKQAQEDWNLKILESAHNMSLARIEMEAYKDSNIFGVENPYAKAIAGARQYSAAMLELKTTANILSQGQVQTGTKQQVDAGNIATGIGAGAAIGAAVGSFIPVIGNLLGAAIGAVIGGIAGAVSTKTVPVFESLAKTYGEIFDKDTFELNPQILADYDKLDDATKSIIDNWQEIADKAREAQEQMRQTFSDLAGEIGSMLSDELVNAFRGGDVFKAVDSFKGKVTTVIEDIISQLIFAQYFEGLFKNLENEMMDSFGHDGDQNIVDDIVRFSESYKNALGEYSEAMTTVQEELAKQGFDIFTNARAGASKGFQSMSQESANELNGRFTAIQAYTYQISESIKSLLINSAQSLKYLSGIESHTSRLETIEKFLGSLKSGIDDINIKGVYIRG